MRRDPYEVLGVSRNSTDQEIKTAYRKMALKYHPDKNANDPDAANMFKEETFSYNILSDTDKRRQYDSAGFELLYFDQEENGGLSLVLQSMAVETFSKEESGVKFQNREGYFSWNVVPWPPSLLIRSNRKLVAKDADAAFFNKLDAFQPCEITDLKAGTHFFAIYGDNFFKSATYSIEALCAAPFNEEKTKLRTVEAQILAKRVEISKFESEYRKVLAQFTEMTNRDAHEMQEIDEFLKQRNEIHAAYTIVPPIKRSPSKGKKKVPSRQNKEDGQVRDKKHSTRDISRRKKWFSIHLKVDKRKPC